MFLSKWFVSIVALLAVGTRTRALHQNDVEDRLCYSYQCPLNPGPAACEGAHVATRLCPADLPYCATVATAPNFTSSLTCAAASETTCTLMHLAKQSYEMTCACTTNLCNAPFSPLLQNELINFSSTFVPTNFRGDFTAVFWKSSSFENSTKENDLYKMITIEATLAPTQFFSDETTLNNVGQDSTMKLLRHSENLVGPRVAALKEESAELDDDEDGGEGSGAGAGADERTAPAPAPDPAAPSSFLPADKSKAALLLNNFLTTTLIIFNIIM